MAIKCNRLYYKYGKCLIITVLIGFFIQLFIAAKFFPSDTDSFYMRNKQNSFIQDKEEVSARKIVFSDDEDLNVNVNSVKKTITSLRIEELDFKPTCEIQNREAISAIHRAKTQKCKQEILNKTCLIQNGNFYPLKLHNNCPSNGLTYGMHLGCYQDEKKMRLLTSFYGNYGDTNSPSTCLDICVQAGYPYAGVQYA